MKQEFKYIYGPVASWRLGRSLGIDLLSQEEKVCDFDCVYCQLGRTRKYTRARKTYVPLQELIQELRRIPESGIDYITFSGRGEPGLAANLGEAIQAVKSVRKEPVAVITNASLMQDPGVRQELAAADLVIAKLDGCSQQLMLQVNRPAEGISFESILDGLQEFRKQFRGKLALQMMFIDKNKASAEECIPLVNLVKPDEVQINTPLRRCDAVPLEKSEIERIKQIFVRGCKGMRIVSVYERRVPGDVASFSADETLRRRGKEKGHG